MTLMTHISTTCTIWRLVIVLTFYLCESFLAAYVLKVSTCGSCQSQRHLVMSYSVQSCISILQESVDQCRL